MYACDLNDISFILTVGPIIVVLTHIPLKQSNNVI